MDTGLALAVERLKNLDETYVDCGFRQGREVVLEQLSRRAEKDMSDWVDSYILDMQSAVHSLSEKLSGYSLPGDYIDFLENFAGLMLWRENYTFSVNGIGPMVEDWYSGLEADGVTTEFTDSGILPVGTLNFGRNYRYQEIEFFLDLSGRFQLNSVIGVGPCHKGTQRVSEVLKTWRFGQPALIRIQASSFTQWMTRVADTAGAFGYDQQGPH